MFPSLSKLGATAWRWAESNQPWTNVYGLARTLLALGTASTLIANETGVLFRPAAGILQHPICEGVGRLGVFCLGSSHPELIRWICVIILLVVASGWRPRYTALFHWWIVFSFQTSAVTLDGGDQISAILALLILPVALTDGRRWHWQSSGLPEDVNANTRTLRKIVALTALVAIRVQVSIVYFHAATGKLSVEEWVNGTALYYWLTNPTFGLPDWLRVMEPLLTSRWIVVITWAVLFVETGLFMALVMPKGTRKYWLIVGILFHVGIAVTMGLFSFSLAMCAALILYLRPPEQQFGFSAVTNLFRRNKPANRAQSAVPNLANY